MHIFIQIIQQKAAKHIDVHLKEFLNFNDISLAKILEESTVNYKKTWLSAKGSAQGINYILAMSKSNRYRK